MSAHSNNQCGSIHTSKDAKFGRENMIELRHLRYFAAVAKELSVGRAAIALNISQPPLTRQIQQLEDQIGAKLFLRSVRGMELTDAGRTLFEDASDIMSL